MTNIESNIAAFAAKLKVRAKRVEKGVQDGLDNAAKYAVQQEKALVTPHKKTGALNRSITWIQSGKYTRLVNPIIEDHGKYLEKGRGPVTAKNAQALRFMIKGQVFFRKSVGPAKARPFVEPTKKGLKVMYPRIMSTEINKALR